jgi:hypothetical protein
MTALEDRLRESLHHYAALPRPSADLADTAIADARGYVARWATTAVIGAVFVVAAAAAGVSVLSHGSGQVGPGVSPSATVAAPTATAGRVRLDLRENSHQILTMDNQLIELPGVGGLRWVARVPDGWLYTGDEGPPHLMRLDGKNITLPTGRVQRTVGFEQPPGLVVDASGRFVAWTQPGKRTTVSVGRLTQTGLSGVVNTVVPLGGFAANWIGHRVVIGQAYGTGCCGYDKTRYDVWDPTAGTFAPQWANELSPVYGPVPDGIAAFGMAMETKNGVGCLAQLDGVRDLSATGYVCLPGLAWGSLVGALSPDGRHLVEMSAHGGSDSLILVELPGVVQTKAVVRSYPAGQGVIWEDNSHVIVVDDNQRVIRYAIDSDVGVVVGQMTADTGWVPRYGV